MGLSIKQKLAHSAQKLVSYVPKKVRLPLASVLIAGTAATAMAFSYGAVVSVQPESGTLSGGTTIVADANASGGQSVKFNSGGAALVKPTLATVGPRCSTDITITATEALNTLRDTNYLSCVTVNGQLTLAGSDGIDWVIEDVRILGGSTYGLRAYIGPAYSGTYAQRAVFRHVEIVGRGAQGVGSSCSAAAAIRNVVIENANIYGCQDGIKAWENVNVRYSWVHDLDHPDGAHADAVQIVNGLNQEFHGNRFDAYVGYSSDGSMAAEDLGQTSSGLLQTGSVTGDISATWTNNWFAGGHYTIRGETDATYNVAYTFRDNIFMRQGTSVTLGRTDLDPNRFGATYGNTSTAQVWINNVWDDTGDPVN